MALPFLGLFIAFIAVISFFRKRSDRLQQDTEDAFWEREHQANLVRRKDISSLSYIIIPFEDFSIGVFQDTQLSELEQTLKSFSDKKILNLTGLSNTDLKMQYGPANLPALMEYDQNFTYLLHTLTQYIDRLIELEHLTEAVPVLEFCIEIGSDISAHYLTLADYYKNTQQSEKIQNLCEKASELNSLTKASILSKLEHL